MPTRDPHSARFDACSVARTSELKPLTQELLGMGVGGRIRDSFSFMGEYIAAAEDIDYVGGETLKQPKAWMVEFAYNWKIGERDTVAAFGYQATDNLAGVLPESRILGTFGIGVTDGVTAALEYAHDNDYDTNEGGTGETGHAVTAELALSF